MARSCDLGCAPKDCHQANSLPLNLFSGEMHHEAGGTRLATKGKHPGLGIQNPEPSNEFKEGSIFVRFPSSLACLGCDFPRFCGMLGVLEFLAPFWLHFGSNSAPVVFISAPLVSSLVFLGSDFCYLGHILRFSTPRGSTPAFFQLLLGSFGLPLGSFCVQLGLPWICACCQDTQGSCQPTRSMTARQPSRGRTLTQDTARDVALIDSSLQINTPCPNLGCT